VHHLGLTLGREGRDGNRIGVLIIVGVHQRSVETVASTHPAAGAALNLLR